MHRTEYVYLITIKQHFFLKKIYIYFCTKQAHGLNGQIKNSNNFPPPLLFPTWFAHGSKISEPFIRYGFGMFPFFVYSHLMSHYSDPSSTSLPPLHILRCLFWYFFLSFVTLTQKAVAFRSQIFGFRNLALFYINFFGRIIIQIMYSWQVPP